jgi:peptidoglycan/xylan/chitin deacetylase (PgdA/CDA1 family)
VRGLAFLVVVSVSAHASAEPLVAAADKPVVAPLAPRVEKPKKPRPVRLIDIKPEPTELTNDPVLGVATRVNGAEMKGLVAFTFDDGPNPATTPTVIDALEKYDIPATFFIVTQRLLGKHGEAGRELLAKELEHGFTVGSHSVSHRWLGKADNKLLDRELVPSLKTLSQDSKRPIGLFRAPYGALSGTGRVRLRKLGVTEVFWSIDTLDWKAKDATKLRKRVLKMILDGNGGVVLMHDIRPLTAKIIEGVLDDLEAENCKRLSESREPIWPVSLHYFLRDGKAARAIPEDVTKRTEAYKKALPERCTKRPLPEAKITVDVVSPACLKSAAECVKPPQGTPLGLVPAVAPPASGAAAPAQMPRPVGDFPCSTNPLAKGCGK